MRVGLLIFSEGEARHLGGLLYSLHEQTWEDWGAHYFDIGVPEKMADETVLTANRNARCGVFAGKMSIHRGREVGAMVASALSKTPPMEIVAAITPRHRLDYRLLREVDKIMAGAKGAAWLPIKIGVEGKESPEEIFFMRRRYLDLEKISKDERLHKSKTVLLESNWLKLWPNREGLVQVPDSAIPKRRYGWRLGDDD